jgi:hypothetical protein
LTGGCTKETQSHQSSAFVAQELSDLLNATLLLHPKRERLSTSVRAVASRILLKSFGHDIAALE